VTLGWVLLNTAYLVYTVSGLFKDMLRLRLVWMVSTLFFMAHGLVDQLWPAVWWNVPVLLVHLYMVGSLLRQRRAIDLDEESMAIRTLVFPELDLVAFNTLWNAGTEHIARDDEVLITRDEEVRELFLILEGDVDAHVSDNFVVRLGEYRLLGEVSSLTGANATATVTAVGNVRIRTWDKQVLAGFDATDPEIRTAILLAMGYEAARKLT